MPVSRSVTWVLFAVLLGGCTADVAGPNRAPVAEAGPDRWAQLGEPAALSGASSWDPDGDTLGYAWKLIAQPQGASAWVVPLDAPDCFLHADKPGTYLISLAVHDFRAWSERDLVRVTILSGCRSDDQCADADPCTLDRCEAGACAHTPDPACGDLCPDDPLKTDPGQCGCGVADYDGDSDGTADCLDGCPLDPAKVEPGQCGCAVADDDGDGDGTADCVDGCPADPAKAEPGQCGCAVADEDGDGDGTADCVDGCPDDPAKADPGQCGCAVADDDGDGDGTADCVDGCPGDPAKIDPGQCGCGLPDQDTDADGVMDCDDPCPLDVPDDSDGDGACDSDDCAPWMPGLFPGAPEVCNAVDDDCDGEVDEEGCACQSDARGGHRYLFCPGPASWTEARAACRALGYHLATANDSGEDMWLVQRIEALLGADALTWHGLNDRAAEGRFDWADGAVDNHRRWAGGQPNDHSGQDCVLWERPSDGGGWNDDDCGSDRAYVCESACATGPDADGDGWADACDCGPLDPTIAPGGIEVCNGKDDDCDGVADGLPACPCPVELWNGRFYHFCATGTDWTSARDACREQGAELVSIDSVTENRWLMGRIDDRFGTPEVWHGFNDVDQEGAWGWVDGSPVNYTNWRDGEPNDAGPGEDCGSWFDDGEWNDAGCGEQRPYVCASDPCPDDPYNDLDGDGLCGSQDACPTVHDPDQQQACRPGTCAQLLAQDPGLGDGLYWIREPGSLLAFRVWCDMTTAGGGWTLVAIYGNDLKPGSWSGNPYPRPGAAHYGQPSTDVFDPLDNDQDNPIRNYSVDAQNLWPATARQILVWVGDTTDDSLTATLPAGCNFFDGGTYCEENVYGPFSVLRSDGSELTADAYACTTAHHQGAWVGDPYDEFGLNLIDGLDTWDAYNCFASDSSLGFQDVGRIFSSFQATDGSFWNAGVHSHWSESGQHDVPGALLIR